MYQANFYPELDQNLIAKEVRKEGFDPIPIDDPPGRPYPSHLHSATKLLVFLKGAMEVQVAGNSYACKAGDKLVIPGNVKHSAVVGPEGCLFFWSEKL